MVALDVFLVPRYGIVGAAVGSLAAYWIATVLVVHRWCGRTGVGMADLLVPRPSDVSYILHRVRHLQSPRVIHGDQP